MNPTSPQPSDRWLNLLDPAQIGRWLLLPMVRLVAAWLVAVVVAWYTFYFGWNCMNAPQRLDKNNAHVNIDFSGQYLLGRMIIKGEGRYLYRRSHQDPVLKDAYPAENEWDEDYVDPNAQGAPAEKKPRPENKPHDWEEIEGWMIGVPETDISGPLYPPVHAMLCAPLTYLPPLLAYRVMQVITFLLTFIVAYLAELITDGRIWCPVALVLVIFVPGYMGALGLGQNPLLTLTLLMTGWWLFTTKQPVLGGVAWGFLAYKPVWAVAFLPVLLLTGRWRAAAAMVVTGIVLGVATLPMVGWDLPEMPTSLTTLDRLIPSQCWRDWFAMGRLASDRYSWDENWLVLSRDLINLPRRPFITHNEIHEPIYTYDKLLPDFLRGKVLPDVLSFTLWCGVMAVSLAVALLRRRQVSAAEGAGPAFLLLAGWMSCLHFMYYDVMLTFLPLCLLFSDPRRFLRVAFWPRPRQPLPAEVQDYYKPSLAAPPPMPLLPGGRVARWVINPLPPLLLVLLLVLTPLMIWHDPGYHFPPVDTFCILAMWAWCGWTVWKQEAWPQEPAGALATASQDENPYQVPAEVNALPLAAPVLSVFSPGGAADNSQERRPLDRPPTP